MLKKLFLVFLFNLLLVQCFPVFSLEPSNIVDNEVLNQENQNEIQKAEPEKKQENKSKKVGNETSKKVGNETSKNKNEATQEEKEKSPEKPKKEIKNLGKTDINNRETSDNDSEKSTNATAMEPVSHEKIELPKISGSKFLDESILTNKESKNTGEKLVRSVFSVILIIGGLIIILWVILKNKNIPKEKNIKIKDKRRLYYKNSHRK